MNLAIARRIPRVSATIIFSASALAVATSALHADTAITTPIQYAVSVSNNVLFGFAFTSGRNLNVTALGVIDPWFTGAQPNIQVALFDGATQGVLASTVVPGGTAAPLVNGSRFQAITPLTLTAGHAYRLAMYIPTGPSGYFFGNSGTVNPPITVTTTYFDPFIGHMGFPTANPYPPTVVMPNGPNFIFNVVPEPATVMLLAVLALGILRASSPSRRRLAALRIRAYTSGPSAARRLPTAGRGLRTGEPAFHAPGTAR